MLMRNGTSKSLIVLACTFLVSIVGSGTFVTSYISEINAYAQICLENPESPRCSYANQVSPTQQQSNQKSNEKGWLSKLADKFFNCIGDSTCRHVGEFVVGDIICIAATAACPHAVHYIIGFDQTYSQISGIGDFITNPSLGTLKSAACNAGPIHYASALLSTVCNIPDKITTEVAKLTTKGLPNPPRLVGPSVPCPKGFQLVAASNCPTATQPLKRPIPPTFKPILPPDCTRNLEFAANVNCLPTAKAPTSRNVPLAAHSPYSAGYSHGCDDGKAGFHKYLNTSGKGVDFHTTAFMQGYDDAYKACFSPNGTGKVHSHSDTGHTFVSCNKSQHSIEYCNGYRAGAVQSDVDDDPDENITPSQVTCDGGSSGSEYCAGYQQGYSDEDHKMFSPSPTIAQPPTITSSPPLSPSPPTPQQVPCTVVDANGNCLTTAETPVQQPQTTPEGCDANGNCLNMAEQRNPGAAPPSPEPLVSPGNPGEVPQTPIPSSTNPGGCDANGNCLNMAEQRNPGAAPPSPTITSLPSPRAPTSQEDRCPVDANGNCLPNAPSEPEQPPNTQSLAPQNTPAQPSPQQTTSQTCPNGFALDENGYCKMTTTPLSNGQPSLSQANTPPPSSIQLAPNPNPNTTPCPDNSQPDTIGNCQTAPQPPENTNTVPPPSTTTSPQSPPSSANLPPSPPPTSQPVICPDGSPPAADGSCPLPQQPPPQQQPITCPDGSLAAADGSCPSPPEPSQQSPPEETPSEQTPSEQTPTPSPYAWYDSTSHQPQKFA
jgi:hypothetical protein